MAIKLDKTKLVRALAQKRKLVPHLEKVIAQGDFPWTYEYEPKQGDDAWHPSGHCTPSLVDLYWAAVDPPEDSFSSSLYKAFQVGHFWHQWLQCIVAQKLEFCDTASIERPGVKVWAWDEEPSNAHGLLRGGTPKPFHWATGSGDIAPCDLPGYGEFVVDFKTMGSHDYKRPHLPEWCADKYECQINVYMDLFDLDQGLIVAILKDSPHDMKEFTFERNQPLIDAIHEKWEFVSHCVSEKIEPTGVEEIPLPLKGPTL